MKNIIFQFFFLALLFSCKKKETLPDAMEIEKLDFGKVSHTAQLDITQYFENSNYLQLKVPDEFAFFHADKIFHGNGKYFIADMELEKALYAFDEKGNYLFHINSGGFGPEELPNFEDVVFNHDSNSILFLGAYGRKLYEYDDSGAFMREIALPENGFYNFMAYEGNGKLWLYTLPPPPNKLAETDFKLLTVLDLNTGQKAGSFIDVPEGLRVQVSGVKEISYQNGNIVFAMAFGNRIYKLSSLHDHSKAILLQSVSNTNNFYGLDDFDLFISRVAENRELVYIDNYITTEKADFFILLEAGATNQWGVWNKKEQSFSLAKTLLDGNLELPLFPYLDSHKNKVIRLLDPEFFDIVFESENADLIINNIQQYLPNFKMEENTFLLCVYEN